MVRVKDQLSWHQDEMARAVAETPLGEFIITDWEEHVIRRRRTEIWHKFSVMWTPSRPGTFDNLHFRCRNREYGMARAKRWCEKTNHHIAALAAESPIFAS